MANISSGFFEMCDVNQIFQINTLADAKSFARHKVDDYISAHPGVKNINVRKVEAMIAKSTTKIQLASGIADFVLAHPSENLKVIK